MNYADWDNPLIQSGRLYEVLRKYDMPFLVMEPVKGGSLASAGKEIEAEMKRVHPDASIASWALRFAASLPGVATVLSVCQTRNRWRIISKPSEILYR